MKIIYSSFLISVFCLSGCGSSDIEKELSKTQKVTVCKHYFSSLLGRNVNIMRSGFTKEDEGFFAEIIYRRSSDNTEWRNVCHIDNNTMVWATITNGELGRWRFEDEVKLSLLDQGSTLKAGSLFQIKI